MYRGGKICLTDHFKPLWARNVPKFGIAHAMALGVRTFFDELLMLVVRLIIGYAFLLILKHLSLFCLHFIFHFQLSPWLAVEIPDLIEKGVITYKDKNES